MPHLGGRGEAPLAPGALRLHQHLYGKSPGGEARVGAAGSGTLGDPCSRPARGWDPAAGASGPGSRVPRRPPAARPPRTAGHLQPPPRRPGCPRGISHPVWAEPGGVPARRSPTHHRDMAARARAAERGARVAAVRAAAGDGGRRPGRAPSRAFVFPAAGGGAAGRRPRCVNPFGAPVLAPRGRHPGPTVRGRDGTSGLARRLPRGASRSLGNPDTAHLHAHGALGPRSDLSWVWGAGGGEPGRRVAFPLRGRLPCPPFSSQARGPLPRAAPRKSGWGPHEKGWRGGWDASVRPRPGSRFWKVPLGPQVPLLHL